MATYHVDATSGSDSADGLSQANAWQTLGKVNASTIGTGSSVLLKRGETWRERLKIDTALHTGPITVGAYGSGALPIIKATNAIATSGWSLGTSPTSSETFVEDTFTRSDDATDLGDAEGGTDSALTWNQVDAAQFGIASNRGVGNKDFGVMRAGIGDALHTESCDLQIDFVGIPSSSGGTQGVGLWSRVGSGFGAGYQVHYLRSSGVFQFRKVTGGTPVTLEFTSVGDIANATIRVQNIVAPTGQQIRARIWETGTTEPTSWAIDYTDESSPRTTGFFGLNADNGTAGSNVSFDNLVIQSYVPVFAGTYTRTLSTDPARIVLEDGVALALAASADEVEVLPGSFFWASNTLYLHATDGSNPATNGKVYEAATRTSSLWVLGVDDVIVEDVLVEGGTLFGLVMSGLAARPEIRRVTARYTSQYGILSLDDDGGAPVAPWIHHCEVYGNKQYGGIGGNVSGGGVALIEHNLTHDCGLDSYSDHGIYWGSNGSGKAVIRFNVSYGNAAYGIKCGAHITNAEVYRNISYLNGRGDYIADGTNDPGSTGTKFWNNVGYGSPWGLTLYNDGLFPATVDECKNNIFSNNTEFGIHLFGDGNAITVLEANCVFGAPTAYEGLDDATGVDGNISADPLFVSTALRDFQLRPGSPCLGTGVLIDGVTSSVVLKRGTYTSLDMGAYPSSLPTAAPVTGRSGGLVAVGTRNRT